MRKKWNDRPLGFVATLVALLVFVLVIIVIRDVYSILTLTHLSLSDLYSIASSDGETIKQEKGRTNMLLLGSGGGTHEGSDLTDTMIIFSYSHASGSSSLISIPRDIWSETLKDKINTAFHYGETEVQGGGYAKARQIMTEITGIPLQYAVSIDFSGFKAVVNAVGGVNVAISKGFTDPLFPIEGKENDLCDGDFSYSCRYMSVTFTQGIEHMDGERALVYVRSRHADGEEGTDFARSRRQQEVLSALKPKFFDPQIWYSIESLRNVYTSLDNAINTDMSMKEIGTLGKLFLESEKQEIAKISFDDLLVNPPEYLYEGRYVLLPQSGTFDNIQSYLKQKLQ